MSDLPLILTPQEAAQVLRVSRWLIYQSVRKGELRSVHLGRKLLIPRAAIEEFLAGSGQEVPPQPPTPGASVRVLDVGGAPTHIRR